MPVSALRDLDTAAQLQPLLRRRNFARPGVHRIKSAGTGLERGPPANQLDPNSPEGYRLLAEVDRAKDDLPVRSHHWKSIRTMP